MISVTSAWSFGQGKKPHSHRYMRDTIIVGASIVLRDSMMFENANPIIRVLDNDSISIIVVQDELLEVLEKKIKDYDIDEDKDLLVKLNSIKKNKLVVNYFHVEKLKQSRLSYIVASMLEDGNCVVLNKVEHQLFTTITVQYFLKSNHNGRRFYTENYKMVFEIYDGAF